ncbi:MAG: MarR family winged helix-turn-helix transcriptional regulator [Candidatus Dormibacteria bacterium]
MARLGVLQAQFHKRFEAATPQLVRALQSRLGDAMANTTLRQLEVLRLLATNGPLTMHQLAEMVEISRSSATEVIDRLEGHGLAARRHDPGNRRSVEVALTAKAKAVVAQVRRFQRASLAAVTDAYDDQELATLVGLLEKGTLGQHPGEPAPASGPAAAATSRNRTRNG